MVGGTTSRWLTIGVMVVTLVGACGDDSGGGGPSVLSDPGDEAADPSSDAGFEQLRGYVELDEAASLIDQALSLYEDAAFERAQAGDGPAIVPEDEVAIVSDTREGTGQAGHILHSEIEEVIEWEDGAEVAHRLLVEAHGWLVESHDVLSNASDLPPEAATDLERAAALLGEAETALR